jgi:hypothetical protein
LAAATVATRAAVRAVVLGGTVAAANPCAAGDLVATLAAARTVSG